MVRLVFRPYTQIWRSICTSEPLRASIRVSSDFTLFRHSSPSFGSQQMRSYSDLSSMIPDRSMVHLTDPTYVCFHFALGFDTQTLAHLLDSLVRVSRRVVWNHFVSIQSPEWLSTEPKAKYLQSTSCLQIPFSGRQSPQSKTAFLGSDPSMVVRL